MNAWNQGWSVILLALALVGAIAACEKSQSSIVTPCAGQSLVCVPI